MLCGPTGVPLANVDPALALAFEQGARSAVRQAALLLGGGFHAWCAVRSVGVTGYLPPSTLALRGGSAGLSFAVAALSSLAQVPVRRQDAFSAGIRADGMLCGVHDLAMKVTSAAEAGCTRLFVARSDMDEAPRRSHRPRGMPELVPCRHLTDVLEHMGVEDFQQGIVRRLAPRVSSGPAVMIDTGRERIPPIMTASRDPARVLLSFVTPRDPHARADSVGDDMGGPHGDGPLLALTRELHVQSVLLLGVPALHGGDRGFAMAERLKRCAELVRVRSPGVDVRTEFFSSIADPFDEWQAASTLAPFLDRQLQPLSESGAELHVHTSFLPPALHLTLERVLARFPELRVTRWRAVRDDDRPDSLRLERVRAAVIV